MSDHPKMCERCGSPFIAERPSAKFCSNRCRSAAARARRGGEPEQLAPTTWAELAGPGPMETAIVVELEPYLDPGAAGAAVLDIAKRLDSSVGASSAVAALHKELRQARADLAAQPRRELDGVDQLRLRRAQRLAGLLDDDDAAGLGIS